MTFDEWFETVKDDYEYNLDVAHCAWKAALKECKAIIESMEGCTDVDYCKRDGLKQLEELR